MEHEPSSKLEPFIQACKSKGASDDFLAALLIRRGWPADDVYLAMGEYWANVAGIPVPARGTSTESAREAFLYLLAFSTLCSWATALGAAMFAFIDHWFPDAVSSANYNGAFRLSVTWQMATLAVAFPIFLLVMRVIVRGNAAHPEELQSAVRKWLTYIALLATAATMISDLIWVLDYLLSGEITVRFLLRSVVVMIICGSIFLYYFRSLRSRGKQAITGDASWNWAFAVTSALAVIAVFITGLAVAGTPSQIRTHQADTTRVEALKQLASVVKARYDMQTNQGRTFAMPASLTQLLAESGVQTAQMRDPQSQTAYEYHSLSGTRYQLCAGFTNRSDTETYANGSAFWQHPAGRTCYALDASKPVPD